MSLKYFVHVSSISNLSDARYCSGMMVDSLGYNLDENSNNILSCLLYTSPSPRDLSTSRMPSSA